MSSKRVVIEINFNNYGLDPARLTEPWIANRIAIFQKYTLRSLKKQTNQDYLCLIKTAGGCEQIIKSVLGTYPPLPPHIRFVTSIEATRQTEAYIAGYEDLYIARQDSDDLFHKTFVQQLHQFKHKPTTQVLITQNGYMWDTVENTMIPMYFESPQYYTLIYSVKAFMAGKRYKLPGGHGYAIKMRHELLKPRNYVNIVHPSITSKKRLPAHITRLTPANMKNILNDFM